jgi:hypothetical protein
MVSERLSPATKPPTIAEMTNVKTTETRAMESKNITAIAITTAFMSKFRKIKKSHFSRLNIH